MGSSQRRSNTAAERLFAVRLHKGGDITPCISTATPILGNIFDNTLNARATPSRCFKSDGLCSCDIHFQQHAVDGIDDSDNYAAILAGRRLHSSADYTAWKHRVGITTSDEVWVGQGVATSGTSDLLRVAPKAPSQPQ
jgi:hypothetical protein